MALDLEVKNTGDTMRIGYGGYFHIRIEILNTISFRLGDKFEKECLEQRKYFSDELFNEITKLKLDKFIFHSDCNGHLCYRDIKKTLKVLEQYDFNQSNWKDEIYELINLFKIAVENKSYIYYG